MAPALGPRRYHECYSEWEQALLLSPAYSHNGHSPQALQESHVAESLDECGYGRAVQWHVTEAAGEEGRCTGELGSARSGGPWSRPDV